MRSLPSRIATIGLVCASLYAAALGAGAFAQDEEPTPAATAAVETSTPEAPPAETPPAETPTATPSPFPSPVETVVAPTPDPTQTATPTADPTQEPTAAPTESPPRRPPRRPSTRRPRPRPAWASTSPSAARSAASPTAPAALPGRARPTASSSAPSSMAQPLPRVETVSSPRTAAPACDSPLGNDTPAPSFTSSGVPTPANPNYSLATPGPAPIGVPNFFIEKFRIPPFLLPIYQAAGIQYGIRWEVLAAINEIETDYGRNLNISSAGALGWMQFMPATWDAYGVDANGDGQKDPFNPVDAIFAAARYLRAAGADQDLYRAIFAYNHADWYVESVLMRARVIGGLPADLVGSLTGLTQGRFPVAGQGDLRGRAARDASAGSASSPARTPPTSSSPTARAARSASSAARARRSSPSTTAASPGSAATASTAASSSCRTPTATPTCTPALAEVAKTYPFPKERKARKRDLALPEGDVAPRRAASRSTKSDLAAPPASRASRTRQGRAGRQGAPRRDAAALPEALPAKERLFAHPERPNAQAAGGDDQLGRR